MSKAQVHLPSFAALKRDSKFFGGSLLEGKRKSKRGIRAKKLYHVVLRSEIAKGRYNMLKKAALVKQIVAKQARLHHVKVVDYANVGNHLHLLVRPQGSAKYCFTPFIRSISGLIARQVLGVQRGAAKGLQFWDHRPYTRLVCESRKSFGGIKRYFGLNKLESMGVKRIRLEQKDPAALCFLALILDGPPI